MSLTIVNLVSLAPPFLLTELTPSVEVPEYFPRRTLYGTYAKRAELTGGVLPRANLIGTQSRRVNLTGGEG